MADITMPQLGETVTEGTITKWLKNVGDRVEEDDLLFEVSTDKVDSEVPSPASGYLAEILVPEGETVEVGARLAVVTPEAPASGGTPAAVAADEQAPRRDEPDEEVPPAATVEPSVEEQEEAAASPHPSPQTPPRREPAPQPERGSVGAPGGRGEMAAVLSPVVRRLLSENGIDPGEIDGTGVGGRVTRADVLSYLDRRGGERSDGRREPATTTPPARQEPARPAEKGRVEGGPEGAPERRRPTPEPTVRAGEGDEVVPFTNIRRRTAQHMVRSLDTSAHTLIVMEVDYSAVDRVRNPLRESFRAEEGVSLTYLPFIARAVIDALRDFPHVNASVGDDELIVHRYVNLGVAVDLNFEGLIVPVVKGADGKRLRALAREVADLANRARSKRLGADEIAGGTFTITNAGPYGTFLTMPIINQPQVAILGTEGVRMKPVAVELPDGSYGVAVHPLGNLALSFDHRAFDGAYASAFMARVKEILETRDWGAEVT